ncbi:hypothetical protein V1477_002187 [Vespula maculifrons]|uniref:Uncharacterized protein n=1 Tax=Vespula maculifrons TaxID=7453 RepID=A0ABD2CVS7_VESMC
MAQNDNLKLFINKNGKKYTINNQLITRRLETSKVSNSLSKLQEVEEVLPENDRTERNNSQPKPHQYTDHCTAN